MKLPRRERERERERDRGRERERQSYVITPDTLDIVINVETVVGQQKLTTFIHLVYATLNKIIRLGVDLPQTSADLFSHPSHPCLSAFAKGTKRILLIYEQSVDVTCKQM